MKVSIDPEYLSPMSEVRQLGGLYKYNLDYGINKGGSERPYGLIPEIEPDLTSRAFEGEPLALAAVALKKGFVDRSEMLICNNIITCNHR